jgi:hypothetical protein
MQTSITQTHELQAKAMQTSIDHTSNTNEQVNAMQTAITQSQDQVAQILSLLQASSATPRQDAQLARTCRICRTPIAVGPSSPGRVDDSSR